MNLLYVRCAFLPRSGLRNFGQKHTFNNSKLILLFGSFPVVSNSADGSVNHRINSLVYKIAIAMPRSIFAKTLALPLLDRFLLGTLFANLESH